MNRAASAQTGMQIVAVGLARNSNRSPLSDFECLIDEYSNREADHGSAREKSSTADLLVRRLEFW